MIEKSQDEENVTQEKEKNEKADCGSHPGDDYFG